MLRFLESVFPYAESADLSSIGLGTLVDELDGNGNDDGGGGSSGAPGSVKKRSSWGSSISSSSHREKSDSLPFGRRDSSPGQSVNFSLFYFIFNLLYFILY